MTLTLQALEKALDTIGSVGKGEIAFDVAGTSVVLRIIPPEEEALIHRQASQMIVADESGKQDQYSALAYINEVKTGIVAHALIEIDGIDLRGSPFIETGEKLPNGKAVKISRAEAIRKIIRQKEWSSTLQAMMFRKYGELIEEVERQAEKAIVFNPSDRPAEIDRLRKRLEELEEQERQAKEEGEKTVGTEFARKVRSIVAMEDREESPEPPVQEVPPQPEPQLPEQEPMGAAPSRRPLIPQRATPPAPVAQTVVPDSPPPQVLPVVDDSFLDTSDSDEAMREIEAENQRLLRARMGAGQALSPAPESALTAPRAARRPPHLDALEASQPDRNFLGGLNQGSSSLKAPVEEVSRGPQPSRQVSINTPAKGGSNPRFKPTGR
jgi:hypothetical protein